ncbi:MAG TPA: hypothetical protein VK255_04485 [Patescibacteria group bacterium]|nr:hypothetical protein [Patescibacteria group bacterium]
MCLERKKVGTIANIDKKKMIITIGNIQSGQLMVGNDELAQAKTKFGKNTKIKYI